jgi:predicted SnoaL-like aldol condensation-catalyzing enzyme
MGDAHKAANKTLVTRLYEEAFNHHLVAALATVLAVDFVDHAPVEGQAPGRDGFRERVAKGRANVPDMPFTIEELIAERDLVAIRQRTRFTHQGSTVAFTGMGFFRCHAGQIAEAWWKSGRPSRPAAGERIRNWRWASRPLSPYQS